MSLRDVVDNGEVAKCAAVAVVAWQMNEQADVGVENPIKIFFEFMKPSISTRYASLLVGNELCVTEI